MDINKAVKEKLVITKNGVYYVKYEGKFVELGDTLNKAKVKFNILDSSKLEKISASESPQIKPVKKESEAPQKKDSATSKEAPAQEPVTSQKPKDIEDLLGNIHDFEVSTNALGELAVFIDGVDQNQYRHEKVLDCPAIFYWQLKTMNIDNGDGWKNQGWTVVSKVLHKDLIDKYNITWARDDSPNENFVTAGELVLCVMKRSQYFARKEEERARKGDLRYLKTMNNRQEFASRQGMETDPDRLISGYQSQNTAGRQELSKQVSDREGPQAAKEAIAKLDQIQNLSGTELAKATDEYMKKQGMAVQGY